MEERAIDRRNVRLARRHQLESHKEKEEEESLSSLCL